MGPVDALEGLYRRHAAALFRFAYGLTRDRGEAEDIVSETFVRVATRASGIAAVTARAYLLAVARNAFLDRRRRAIRDGRLTKELAETQYDFGSEDVDQARLAAAIEALGVLADGEREAFLLRVDHELSYQEIAATLRISVAAAKVRVHRARLRLASAARRSGS